MNINLLNQISDQVVNWLFQASLQGAIFLLVVSGIAFLCRHKSATFQATLWSLALLRFLMPPQFALSLNLKSPVAGLIPMSVLSPVTVDASSVDAWELNWKTWLFLVWLVIFVVWLLFFVFQNFHFRRFIKHAQPLRRPLPANWQIPTRPNQKAPLILTLPFINGPFTFGVRKPKIFLPVAAETWSQTEFNFILQHEIAHIRRFDLVLIYIQELTQAVFFFHPLVWWLNARLNYFRELACDDYSLQKTGGTAIEYSKVLYNTLIQIPHLPLLTPFTSNFSRTKKSILKRFQHILKPKEEIMLQLSRFQKIVLGMLLVFAIVSSGQEKSTPSAVETPTQDVSLDATPVAYDKAPEPIGGFAAIQNNLVYPEAARKAGLEGKVFVKLLITEQGKVAHAEIIKGANPAMDSAAIQALKGVKWQPARLKDQPLKVTITLPVMFRLNDATAKPAAAVDHSVPQPVGGMAAIAAQIKYPELARRAGITGEVHVQLLIDEQGKIEKTEVVKSLGKDNGLDEAAVEAVRKVIWQPAQKDGKAFKTTVIIPVRFNLN
ncbi:M56 family metallopeptidase [candidate division KSB1 bacterium]|nr:M56 family metallopeptidase [candidate division KSB1 bacterium]